MIICYHMFTRCLPDVNRWSIKNNGDLGHCLWNGMYQWPPGYKSHCWLQAFRESYVKVLILNKGPWGLLATPFLFFSLPLTSPPPKVMPTISNRARLSLLHSQTGSELGQRAEHIELPPVPLPLVPPQGKVGVDPVFFHCHHHWTQAAVSWYILLPSPTLPTLLYFNKHCLDITHIL